MMNQTTTQSRQYFLDWLKIFATAMVFLLHCAHIFDEIPYHIDNEETSVFMGALVLFLNYWIMPLFFFIAGGSSYYSLLSRPNTQYVFERFQRLIIPYIAGSILLTPILNYAEALNHELFTGSFPGFIQFEFIRCRTAIIQGAVPFSPRILGIIGHHLWFLAFLFLYSIITLPLFRYRIKMKNNRTPVNKIYRGAVSALVMCTFLFTPLDPVYQGWTTFLIWGLFFLAGFFILPNEAGMNVIKKKWKIHLLTGTISFTLAAVLLIRSNLTFFTAPEYSVSFALYSLCAVAASWSWVLFFIGIGYDKLDHDKPVRRLLSKGAMPFYIIHQPVIIVSALFIVELQRSIITKFTLILCISVIVTTCISGAIIHSPRYISVLFGIKTRKTDIDKMDFTEIMR